MVSRCAQATEYSIFDSFMSVFNGTANLCNLWKCFHLASLWKPQAGPGDGSRIPGLEPAEAESSLWPWIRKGVFADLPTNLINVYLIEHLI